MFNIIHGDCLDILPTLEPDSVDCVVTDPPYHLTTAKQTSFQNTTQMDAPHRRYQKGFMGKEWDGGDVAFQKDTWAKVLRVMKPGGHLLAFGGTRTFHRMVCAIEDAGFEIRDTLMWVYGSGFAKSWNLRRADLCCCDAKTTEQTTQHYLRQPPLQQTDLSQAECIREEREQVLQPLLSQQGEAALEGLQAGAEIRIEEPSLEGRPLHRAGQGICPDPAARTPASAEKRLCAGTHTGSGGDVGAVTDGRGRSSSHRPQSRQQRSEQPEGLCESSGALDDRTLRGRGACQRCGKVRREFEGHGTAIKPAYEPIILARKPLSETSVARNVLKWGTGAIAINACRIEHRWPANFIHDGLDEPWARYFYCPKASKKDRFNSNHPTCKPIALLEYLAKLICPPGGTILDPFAGSGTIGAAAHNLGVDCIMIEREDEYVKDIRRRMQAMSPLPA